MIALALLPLGWTLWLGFDSQRWWPLALLLVMSLLTLCANGYDKRQAVRGEWRIPESRLHMLELCGGWPGALIAQQLFRHKTRKRRYQMTFWFIVLLHLTLWGLWVGRSLWP